MHPDDPNVSSSSRGGDKDTMQNSEGAYGQLFKDTWQIGNTKVGNVSFRGTANDLGAWAFVGLGGIMDTQNDSLTTMTAALVAAGLSTTSAYSVWLGDLGTCLKDPIRLTGGRNCTSSNRCFCAPIEG